MGREAKAAAVTSSAKNIPHECQDLVGLCVCACVCACVWSAYLHKCKFISASLLVALFAISFLSCLLPSLPSAQGSQSPLPFFVAFLDVSKITALYFCPSDIHAE